MSDLHGTKRRRGSAATRDRSGGFAPAILALAIGLAGLIWLLFGQVRSPRLAALPSWAAVLIMTAAVITEAVALLARSVPWGLRLLALALFEFTLLLLPNFVHRFPLLTVLVLAVVYLEAYVVAPRRRRLTD
jgi:hypothetical protein